jgi:hypothetical protein
MASHWPGVPSTQWTVPGPQSPWQACSAAGPSVEPSQSSSTPLQDSGAGSGASQTDGGSPATWQARTPLQRPCWLPRWQIVDMAPEAATASQRQSPWSGRQKLEPGWGASSSVRHW